MMHRIRYVIIILVCLSLIGCSSIFKRKKAEAQVMQLKQSILEKDKEIRGLKDLLNEKNIKIQELKKKLEMFGVFEK